jgi:hypothetical protein
LIFVLNIAYLPKLQIFQLKMRLSLTNEKYKKELFRSFQTRFWLEEHQWYIRYHYNLDGNSNMVCLYTLPFSFSYSDILFPLQYQSTCPNEQDYLSYNQVQHLDYRSSSSSSNEMTTSPFCFPNINLLTVTLPINNHLLLMIRKLDQLTSLEISRPKTMLNGEAQL